MTFDPYHTWLGIPPEHQPPDHYQLLGLQRFESNRDAIANAMDQRMSHLRSLQSGDHAETSQRLLNEVAAASRCLLNDESRQDYDDQMRSRSTPDAVPVEVEQPDSCQSVLEQPDLDQPAIPTITTSQPAAHSGRRVQPRSQATVWWITGSAVATICVVVLVMVMMRSGPVPAEREMPKQAAKTDSNQVAATVAPTLPSISPSPLGSPNTPTVGGGISPLPSPKTLPSATQPLTHPNAETSPQTISPDPFAQPSPKSPTDPSRHPPRALPTQGPFGLEFGPGDGLALSKTKNLIRWDQPFTCEMWVRHKPLDRELLLIGDCILGGVNGTVGWQLWMMPSDDPQRVRFAMASEKGFFAEAAAAPGWRHVAVTNDQEQIRLFVDGRQCTTRPTSILAESYRPSPINLHIGAHPHLHAKQPGEFRGQFRALRIVSECLYSVNFHPPESFADVPAELELALDFSKPMDGRILDLSPHKRDGELLGAQWCSITETTFGDPLASNSVTAAPAQPTSSTPTPSESPLATPDASTADASAPPLNALDALDEGKRLVAPNDLSRAMAAAQATFAADIAQAQHVDAKLALSKRLMTLADAEDVAADKLAMYRLAHDLAIQAVGLAAALPIIDTIESQFEFNGSQLRVDDLRAMSEDVRSLEQRREFVDLASQVSLAAVKAEAFELALEAARMSQGQAARAGGSQLKRIATETRSMVESARRNHQAAMKAKQRIEQSPSDAPPEVHETWGLYLSLVRQDWEQGLPHLAKGKSASLRTAAALDLAAENAAERLAVADQWWLMGETALSVESPQRRVEGKALQARAVLHYGLASPELQGVELIRARKRIREGTPVVDSAASKALFDQAMKAPLPRLPQVPIERASMLGGLTVDGMPQLFVMYQNGVRFSDASLRDALRNAQIPPGKVSLELHGLIVLEKPTTVLLRQRGGSLEGGRHSLSVGGRALGEVGGDAPSTGVYRLTLPRGHHPLQWRVQGGDLGTCQLLVIDSEGVPLALVHTPEMDLTLRKRAAPLGRPLATLNMAR